jgi:lysophospholipase L1-like esterase
MHSPTVHALPLSCGKVSSERGRFVANSLPLISQRLASGQASVAQLSAWLREISDATTLTDCMPEAAARYAGLFLDELRAQVWRSHSKARTQAAGIAAGNVAKPNAVTLLPLGDSITDGGMKQRSYRFHLHQLFEENGHRVRWVGSMHGVYDKQLQRNATAGVLVRDAPDWPVAAQRHEGHWGWTSRQVLRGHERQPQRGALDEWLRRLTSARELPDVALVHLGTNDLTKRLVSPRGGKPPPEHIGAIARRVSTIVQWLCTASPKVRIVLATPIPYCRVRKTKDGEDAAARQRSARRAHEAELAHQLYAICAQWSTLSCSATARIACVNMSAAVTCEHLVKDGIHPALGGAQRMGALWFRALQPWMPMRPGMIRAPAVGAGAVAAAAPLPRSRPKHPASLTY